MVTELKPKCYTCLDPNALADLAGFTDCPKLTEAVWFTKDCSSSNLNHRSHKQSKKTYTKQTRLQLEQYTKHIKTV